MKIFPDTYPGSAVATVAADGEVKVWQPLFINKGTHASIHTRVFNVVGLAWKLVGTFSHRTSSYPAIPKHALSRSSIVTKASLDPTCTSLLLAMTDGCVHQWPLPGLIHDDNGSLSTIRDPLTIARKHSSSITDMQMYIHLPQTTMATSMVTLWSNDESRKGNSARVLRVGPLGKDGAVYTIAQLKLLSAASSMVTSSIDYRYVSLPLLLSVVTLLL